MSEISLQQDAIMAALESVPALAAVKVRKAVYPNDCFKLNLSKQSEVFVVYGGAKEDGPGVVSTRRKIARELWFIVSVSTSFRTPTDAHEKLDGTFDLCEAVRKGLEDTSIPELLSSGKFLIWKSDELAEAEGRAANGGSMGFISTYESPQRFM